MFETYSPPKHYPGLRYYDSGEGFHIYIVESTENTAQPLVVKTPHKGLQPNMLLYALAGYLTQFDYSGVPTSPSNLIQMETHMMRRAEEQGVPVAHVYFDHTEDHEFLSLLPEEVKTKPFLVEEFIPGRTYAQLLREAQRNEQKKALEEFGKALGKMHAYEAHYDPSLNNAIWNGEAVLIDRSFPRIRHVSDNHFKVRDLAILFSDFIKHAWPEGYISRVADATAENVEVFLTGYRSTNSEWEPVVRKVTSRRPFFGAVMCATARVATVERDRYIAFEMIPRYYELQNDVLKPWVENALEKEVPESKEISVRQT